MTSFEVSYACLSVVNVADTSLIGAAADAVLPWRKVHLRMVRLAHASHLQRSCVDSDWYRLWLANNGTANFYMSAFARLLVLLLLS